MNLDDMASTHSATWQMVTAQNSGLSANHVTGIAEDAAGDLWFATYGGGLCRHSADGRDWQTYQASDGSLVNDYAGAVTVDAAGRVWAVCDARKVDDVEYPGGICTLSPDGTWQTYERPASERCIAALEADRDGTLWLRCDGWVLGESSITMCDGVRDGPDRFHASEWQAFDGTSWTAYDGDRAALAAWYPHRPVRTRLGWALESDTVWLLGTFRYGELVVDREGHKWVSLLSLGDIVLGGGVARLDSEKDDGEWTVFNEDTGLMSDYVVALSTDSRGNVWVSQAFAGLSRWDGSRWTQFPGGQDGRGDKDLGRCVEDCQGRLWVPSRDGALVYTP